MNEQDKVKEFLKRFETPNIWHFRGFKSIDLNVLMDMVVRMGPQGYICLVPIPGRSYSMEVRQITLAGRYKPVFELAHLRVGVANIAAIMAGNPAYLSITERSLKATWDLAWLPCDGGWVWEAAAVSTPKEFAAILQNVAPSGAWFDLAETFQPKG